jgi:two-component system, OmpR family, phosphate regulon sensor histidine kinase PhoR
MLMQVDRGADAQTAPEIWQFNPRTARGSCRLEGAPPRLEYDSDFLATLLAMAAHDLRQPLQVITGAHDLLAGLLRGDSLRFVLARAEDATTRLGVMLAELAEALQLHILARDPRCKLIPLAALIADLAAELAEAAGAKRIDLCVPRAAGAVFSHRVLLRGMLRNLLRNAIDYTPAGGRVLVLCRRAGAEQRIEVRDNGPGISEDMKSRLFEAFARADRTHPEGVGHGLFIVKCAADLLQHRIEVNSTLGHGCCFAVVAKAAADLPFIRSFKVNFGALSTVIARARIPRWASFDLR